jgi:hypothetical protein
MTRANLLVVAVVVLAVGSVSIFVARQLMRSGIAELRSELPQQPARAAGGPGKMEVVPPVATPSDEARELVGTHATDAYRRFAQLDATGYARLRERLGLPPLRDPEVRGFDPSRQQRFASITPNWDDAEYSLIRRGDQRFKPAAQPEGVTTVGVTLVALSSTSTDPRPKVQDIGTVVDVVVPITIPLPDAPDIGVEGLMTLRMSNNYGNSSQWEIVAVKLSAPEDQVGGKIALPDYLPNLVYE